MLLCDGIVFRSKLAQMPTLIDLLNSEKSRKVWDKWVDFFELRGTELDLFPDLTEMFNKAARLREQSKRK